MRTCETNSATQPSINSNNDTVCRTDWLTTGFSELRCNVSQCWYCRVVSFRGAVVELSTKSGASDRRRWRRTHIIIARASWHANVHYTIVGEFNYLCRDAANKRLCNLLRAHKAHANTKRRNVIAVCLMLDNNSAPGLTRTQKYQSIMIPIDSWTRQEICRRVCLEYMEYTEYVRMTYSSRIPTSSSSSLVRCRRQHMTHARSTTLPNQLDVYAPTRPTAASDGLASHFPTTTWFDKPRHLLSSLSI